METVLRTVKNTSLTSAKKAKNDEFYTVYEYIQKEINAYLEYNPDTFKDKVILLPCDDPEWSNFTKFFAQNFEMLGIKKLISTSYAMKSKNRILGENYQFTLQDYVTDFEMNSPNFNEEITSERGKIFILEKDNNNSGNIDIYDIKWEYLEGDGDFRSDEVKALRDEADIIVTNPPFSLFREFVDWAGEKDFIIIGTTNASTYKEIFPLIMNNRVWLGATCTNEDMVFQVPKGAVVNPKDREKAAKLGYVGDYTRLGNACWFTTLDHGRRHQEIKLMSMDDNIKYSKHKEVKGIGYHKYVNCDCIEVKYVDSIPDDYDGLIGITPTFLEKYNPEQFEIVGSVDADILPDTWKGLDQDFIDLYYKQGNTGALRAGNRLAGYIDETGKVVVPYKRLIIKRRR